MRATCREFLNREDLRVRARKAWIMLSDSHLSSVGAFDSLRMSLAVILMPCTCCWEMGVGLESW